MPGVGGILAIDASPRCGWAYGCLGQRPVWGHWELGAIAQPGPLYGRLFDGIADAIKLHRPEQIVYEAPFAPQQQTNAKTGLVLIGLCALVEFAACRYDVLCSHLDVRTARSKVLGRNPTGGPDKVKPVIVEWAARRGWAVRVHDEADALVLLQYGVVMADKTGKGHFLRHGEAL